MRVTLLRGLMAAASLPLLAGGGTELVPLPGAAAGRSPIARETVRSDRGDPGGGRREDRYYRINGRVRLLLVWTGRDDVGHARLRWEQAGDASVLSLLAGSDPDRAPNHLNQWVYLREERRADLAEVFAIRSMTDAESAAEPREAVLDGPLFGASCAALTPSLVRTATTTVSASTGLTADRLDRVLDHVALAPAWTAKRDARPPNMEVGFLTALERTLTTAPAPQPAPVGLGYFYNHVPYDLTLVRLEDSGPELVEGTMYPVLRTASLAVRNRVTRRVTRFSVTFVPVAACGDDAAVTLPVRIVYQPNWWLKVELRLARTANGSIVPDDPTAEPALLARIRRLCARVTE